MNGSLGCSQRLHKLSHTAMERTRWNQTQEKNILALLLIPSPGLETHAILSLMLLSDSARGVSSISQSGQNGISRRNLGQREDLFGGEDRGMLFSNVHSSSILRACSLTQKGLGLTRPPPTPVPSPCIHGPLCFKWKTVFIFQPRASLVSFGLAPKSYP